MGRRGELGADRACPVSLPGTNLQHRRICATRQPTLYVSHRHPAVPGVMSSPPLLLTPTCVHPVIHSPACWHEWPRASYLINFDWYDLEYHSARNLVAALTGQVLAVCRYSTFK